MDRLLSILRNPALFVALAAMLSPSLAKAQPGDFFDLPDISQLRAGLPNGGGSYCGPTAAANALQWLNDNGYPGLGLDGIYPVDVLDDYILELGDDMGTNAAIGTGGTGSQDIVDGVQGRLDALYPGRFDVGFLGRSSERDSPAALQTAQFLGHSFFTVWLNLNVGHLVLVNIGWYVSPELESGGTRCNGHWVTVTGYDYDGDDFTVRYVDPARNTNSIDTKLITDDDYTLQDASTDDCPNPCINTQPASSWNFARTCGSSCTACTTQSGRMGVQDNVIYIGGVRLVSRPGSPGTFLMRNLMNNQDSSKAAGGSSVSTSVAVHPYKYDLYHCNPNQNQIYKTDFVTNQVTPFSVQASLNQPRRVAFAANGNLLIAMGDPQNGFTLLAVRADGSVTGAATQSTLGAISYHEKYNMVYWWDPSANIIKRYTPELVPAGPPLTLPTGLNFVAPGYLASSPTHDTVYYNHAGSASVFRHNAATNAPLAPLSSPTMNNPDDMVVDSRGTLYIAQATTGPVIEFDSSGQQAPQTLAGTFQATSTLAIMRAVHRPLIEVYEHESLNCDIAWDELWVDCNRNLVPDSIDISEGYSDDVNANGIPDECDMPGDITGDGAVGVPDLLEVINDWGLCDPPPAACPADIAPPGGDDAVGTPDLLLVINNWGG